jgi:hypothetical protein
MTYSPGANQSFRRCLVYSIHDSPSRISREAWKPPRPVWPGAPAVCDSATGLCATNGTTRSASGGIGQGPCIEQALAKAGAVGPFSRRRFVHFARGNTGEVYYATPGTLNDSTRPVRRTGQPRAAAADPVAEAAGRAGGRPAGGLGGQGWHGHGQSMRVIQTPLNLICMKRHSNEISGKWPSELLYDLRLSRSGTRSTTSAASATPRRSATTTH